MNDNNIYEFMARIIINIKAPNPLYDVKSLYWQMVDERDVESFVTFSKKSQDNKYPWAYIQMIVNEYMTWNQQFHWVDYVQLMDMFPCDVLTDDTQLRSVCESVVSNNPGIVTDYKAGRKNSINSLKGQVMKQTKGKADMRIVTTILEELLK